MYKWMNFKKERIRHVQYSSLCCGSFILVLKDRKLRYAAYAKAEGQAHEDTFTGVRTLAATEQQYSRMVISHI